MSNTATKPIVVVPKTLTMDKMAALYVQVTYALQADLSRVDVRFEDEFPEGIPLDAIDIDVRAKYNQPGSGFGSATERVVRLFHLESIPGIERLIALLNLNNQTGHLKSEADSLVGLIRKVWEVNRNVQFREHRLNIITDFWSVLTTYFHALQLNRTLVEDMKNPFTLANYRVLLDELVIYTYCNADDAEGNMATMERWMEKAKTRDGQARQRAASATPVREFDVLRMATSNRGIGHLIESDDQRIAGPYFRQHEGLAVLVVRKSDNHYAIFVRGAQDLKALHTRLDTVEPGRWFLDERPMQNGGSPLLLNGSSSRAAEASSLRPGGLIALIQLAFRHKSRQQQREQQ